MQRPLDCRRATGFAVRLFACAGLALTLNCAAVGAARAQTYPASTVKFINPWTPGGGPDVMARIIAQKLSESWGQPVIVENRPGAAGNIGAEAVAKSAPDGYTLLVAANNILTINPIMPDGTRFDPLKDFVPVTLIGTIPVLLVTNPSVPATTTKELIALAKASPGKLLFGSAGLGSPQHLAAELFASSAGIKMQHVSYRGASQFITDLLADQLHLAFGAINSLLPLAKSGKLRPIGVATSERLAYLADVPTISEELPGYGADIWVAFVAPAGTPQQIVTKLKDEVHRILALPDVRAQLAAQFIEPKTSSPEELTSLVKSDLARWGKVIKEVGLKSAR